MLKNAEKATMLPNRNGPAGPLEAFYYEKGYYPALHPGEAETDPVTLAKPGQKRSSVAVTLGNSYDSWALGEFAKDLGSNDINKKYAPLSGNYKNLWSAKVNMFMPKDAKGNWIDIDPKFEGADYYNENNGWSYKWNVQQDIKGLSQLIGGPENMETATRPALPGKFRQKQTRFLEPVSRPNRLDWSARNGKPGDFFHSISF